MNNEGSLIVNGTQNQMVTFTTGTDNQGNYLYWEGLVFNKVTNNPHSQINYAIIEYVKKTGSGCGPSIVADGAIFINDFNNITTDYNSYQEKIIKQ